MAGGINPTGAQINQQFANRIAKGGSPETTSAAQTSGHTSTVAKSSGFKPPKGGPKIREDGGLELSAAAQEQLKKSQNQEAQDARDAAQHGGVQEAETPDVQEHTTRERQERENAEGVDDKKVPEGFAQVERKDGTAVVMPQDDADKLKALDDLDNVERKVLADIPEHAYVAADAKVASDIKTKGIKEQAQLKSDPKVETAAAQAELAPAPMMAEPMDIKSPENDSKNGGPVQMELDVAGEEQKAKEAALRQSASGDGQEMLIAGAGAAGAAVSVNGTANVAEAAETAVREITNEQKQALQSEIQQHRQAVDGVMSSLFQQLPPEARAACQQGLNGFIQEAHGEAQKQGQTIDQGTAYYRGVAIGAGRNLMQLAENNGSVKSLMTKHTGKDGSIDFQNLSKDMKKLAEQSGDWYVFNGANSALIMDRTLRMESASEALKTGSPEALQGHRDRLEGRTSQSWNNLNNPETWKAAGMTAQDAKGIRERADQQALEMVGGNAQSPMYGEAQYVGIADQIARWSEERAADDARSAQTQKDKEAAMRRAQAQRELWESASDYSADRTNWLQLSR